MEMLWLWLVIQAAVVGLMLLMSRKAKKGLVPESKKPRQAREESREMRELRQMRARSLNLPLSEKARPAQMNEIIGQEDGIRALRAALCGPNPQHVLIYGPPGSR